MNLIGNVLWFLLGGFCLGMAYIILGLVFCITIIGIPFGLQLFKIGAFVMWPFGKNVVATPTDSGCLSIFMNVIWIVFGGVELAVAHFAVGLGFCVTIIGIPFGVQHFKMALLALVPFGKEVV